jgi:NADH-quinone oxidoreductase subunit J
MSLQIISIILGSLTIASALMVVLSKHPIRSVIFLVVTFFFISSLYILMNAQFLAIVNIIVYAGAIMVLFLLSLIHIVDPSFTDHSPNKKHSLISINEQFNLNGANSTFNMVHGLLKGQSS